MERIITEVRENKWKNKNTSLPRSRFLDVTQHSPCGALRDIQKTAARETIKIHDKNVNLYFNSDRQTLLFDT